MIRLPTPCDCSPTSIEEAARICGPAFVYDLTVHPGSVLHIRTLLRDMNCDVKDNVLAPHINLTTDPALRRWEWVLRANGVACGSPGAG